jgi:hypothetical protein
MPPRSVQSTDQPKDPYWFLTDKERQNLKFTEDLNNGPKPLKKTPFPIDALLKELKKSKSPKLGPNDYCYFE